VERMEPETERAMGGAGGRGCVLRVMDGDLETFPVERAGEN